MKTVISVFLIASFLETTVLPLNLVLLILICRSFIKTEKSNLYLAFGFGLLTSHLNLTPLGLNSLLYLMAVEVTQLLSKFRLATNSILIIPLAFVLLSATSTLASLVLGQTISVFPKVIFESILSLPIFYLVRLWEERFIVKKEMKLRF